MIKTDLCELLDLKYPIFQGGMAWIADASLAAAVSNAGGLGIIAAMNARRQMAARGDTQSPTADRTPFWSQRDADEPVCR